MFSQNRTEAVQTATRKSGWAELPKLIGGHIRTSYTPAARHRATAFEVFLAGFWSCFDLILSS